MPLDERLWDALQTHGLTEAHLEMLLRALDLQRNGSVSWHFSQGRLHTCDLRVTFPSQSYVLRTVTERLIDGDALRR